MKADPNGKNILEEKQANDFLKKSGISEEMLKKYG